MIKKILLVDDEEFFLKGLKEGLDEFKDIFVTDICFSVDEAKKLNKKNNYSLIVSDIRLPKKSGLDLFVYLKKRKFKGGFIAMTAYGTEELLKNVKELGGLDVIFKPFNFKWFKDKILDYFSEKGVSGTINSIDLTSVLQMINLEKKSITVKISNNEDAGFLCFENGDIIHSKYKEFEGIDAAKHIISMNKGKFSFVKNGDMVHKSIDVPFITLMMNAMKFNDEDNFRNSEVNNLKENKMNVKKLEQAIEVLKTNLGEGLLSTDIWDSGDGQPIMGWNSNPVATALFNRITGDVSSSLKDSGFPSLGRYYIMDLVDSKMVIVLTMGDYQWDLFLDASKVQLGLLLNVAIPKAIDSFEEAISD